jgi:hypothetical protein
VAPCAFIGCVERAQDAGISGFEEAVFRAWGRETSLDPDRWSPRNPAWGQCAVTALLVQDMLGGRLLRSVVQGTSHYWNLFPDGRELDLTLHQFGPKAEPGVPEERSREYVLSFPDTARRYGLLRLRVANELENVCSREVSE